MGLPDCVMDFILQAIMAMGLPFAVFPVQCLNFPNTAISISQKILHIPLSGPQAVFCTGLHDCPYHIGLWHNSLLHGWLLLEGAWCGKANEEEFVV